MGCDVCDVTESLENELCSLYVRHSSFSNPSVASPTSQLILQPSFHFSYVTGFSLTSPGGPPMALSVSKHVPTRLVYQLAGTPNFIEDLVSKHNLRPTQICEKFLEEQAQKVTEIDPGFYRTPVMTEGEWKTAGYELRHLYTRGAIHGFTNVYAAEMASTTLTVNVFVNSVNDHAHNTIYSNAHKKTFPISHYAKD